MDINSEIANNNNKICMNNCEDNYIIKTKVNKGLLEELGINDITFEKSSDWTPPMENGLKNSDYIIPQYYQLHRNPKKIFTIDYFEIIKDDIRNLRPLNKYKLEYIKSLPNEYKDELLEIFNSCIETVNQIL